MISPSFGKRNITTAVIMYQPKTFSDIAEPFSELNTRQQEIITLVCDGLSNKEIVPSRIELMIALADRRRSQA
jgi:DNA-binding NarL/FixJ family response regulator